VKIYNASDRVQKVEFNSHVYVFPIGKNTEIVGQDMVETDSFGRQLEGGRSIPNPNATADIIANHILTEGRDKGLALTRGDGTDLSEYDEARKRFVKATTAAAKAIEARWTQRVLDARANNQPTPAMPDYVEQAQDFLIKNKGGISGTHKRFVVNLDGRSFDKMADAKKHIAARYPNKAKDFEKYVDDTNPIEESVESEEAK